MFKHRDLIKRVIWSMIIVAIYLLGQKIILPVIDPAVAKESLSRQTVLQNFGVLTGSEFKLPTLFSLGIGPYMTGMIVWQAVTSLGLDSISHLSQRQVSYIQKWIALGIATLQGIQLTYFIRPSLMKLPILVDSKMASMMIVMLMLLAGTMLAIFLGDWNAQHGLGGTSMLILPGIIMGLPNAISSGWGKYNYKLTPDHITVIAIVTVIALILLIPVMHAERRIKLERPMLEGKLTKSYLPIRILSAGAMPFMFSMSLFMLPRTMLSPETADTQWGQLLWHLTDYHSWTGIVTYAFLLMFLGYAFGLITVQPGQLAKNMKETGDYFLNVFPGDDTSSFLFRHFIAIVTFGNLFLVILGVTPLVVSLWTHDRAMANYSAYFGSLSILVSIMDNVVNQFRALYQKNTYRLF